jgi:hypothetical protein
MGGDGDDQQESLTPTLPRCRRLIGPYPATPSPQAVACSPRPSSCGWCGVAVRISSVVSWSDVLVRLGTIGMSVLCSAWPDGGL